MNCCTANESRLAIVNVVTFVIHVRFTDGFV